MEMSKTDYGMVALLLALIAVTIYGFVNLSGEIAISLDFDGTPGNYMGVIPGLLILPGIGIAVVLFFQILPSIDPLGENYKSFEDLFDFLKLLIAAIFVYLQGMIIAWNLGYRYNPAFMVAPIIFSVYLIAAKILEKAERNWFIGIKTPWTLSSDEVWEKTHKRTAPLFKIASLATLLPLVFPEYSIQFYVIPAVLITLFSTVYSYWIYRKLG